MIPVDVDGYFYIDWSISGAESLLTEEAIHDLLAQALQRLEGLTNRANLWQGKLVLVGSSGVVGNNLTDRGATPLRADTVLVSKHWNIANSLITGRFVRRAPLGLELTLIAVLGLIAAALTWKLRVLAASVLVGAAWIGYSAFAILFYVRTRYWLPLFYPLAGALLVTHMCLVTWRVVFEQAERRRLKSIFSTIVSPKIVHELLQTERLALGGARREVSIFFADVRGFTEFTDASQEKVAEFVRQNHLTAAAAAQCFNEQAQETLDTINLYLGCVAETILQLDGTLDRIHRRLCHGFLGCPTPNYRSTPWFLSARRLRRNRPSTN